jgi:hypothetical protein
MRTSKKTGIEKSLAEKAAEQLARAGALADMQMTDDDPNGKEFGRRSPSIRRA